MQINERISKDYTFLDSYLDVVALNYGSGLNILDFMGDTEGSRQIINGWVEDMTEERIKDLIPEGAISVDTRLVLTNAVYFNAAWASKFEEEYTVDGTFTKADGTEVTTPMMNQETGLPYADLEDYQVLRMPYDGNELEMVILLPDAGKFEEVESKFSPELLTEAYAATNWAQIGLSFPSFEFEADYSLKAALTALGMTDAFTGAADFSGITGKAELYIADVIHKTFVKVDESGTEAAAATAVIFDTESVPPEAIPVKVDRPFIFLVRDMATNSTVFLGRVMDPTEK